MSDILHDVVYEGDWVEVTYHESLLYVFPDIEVFFNNVMLRQSS